MDFVTGQGPKVLSVVFIGVGKLGDNVSLLVDETGQEVRSHNLRAYFLRPNETLLSRDNVRAEVQFGSVAGKGLSMVSLKRIMEGFVEKQVANNSELSGHFHRCMANLTDAVHHADGATVLYCPNFEEDSLREASQDKERLQIMESVVIHWTRQIKEVVNNHDSSSSAETAGPLDEIEFWKGRARDFVGIQKQLEGTGVCKIIDVLQDAKSSYIGPFQTLTQQIVARAAEANDNLKYLETIRDQCTALRTIEADKLVGILPDLLNRIRLIWSFSAFYNDNDRVCGILRKISNEVIRRFRGHVPVGEILDGDVEFSVDRLQEAIDCGVEWKAIFHRTVDAIQRNKVKYSNRVWEIDDASVFAQIDAFVQRCRDLIEVCDNQMQFVRKSAATKGQPGALPQFGGTRAPEIVSSLTTIQKSFQQQIDHLRGLDYDVLDVRVARWHDDYHSFKGAVKDLEVMFTNVINAAFESTSTVAEGVILTETFFRLARREAVKRCVDKKATEIQHLFINQVVKTRSEFDLSRLNPPLRMQEPQYAGSALWAHGLAALVTESYESLARLREILTTRDSEEAHEAYTALISVIQDFKQARYNQWAADVAEKAKDNGLQVRLEKTLLRRAEPHEFSTAGAGAGAATGAGVGAGGGNTPAPAATQSTSSKAGTEIVCNFDEDLLALFNEVIYWEKFHGEFSIPYAAHDLSNKKETIRIARERVMTVVRAYNDIVRDLGTDERHLLIDHLRRLDRRIAPGMIKLTWTSKNVVEMFVKDCCSSCQDMHAVVREFKESKQVVGKISKQIGTTSLLRIDKNVIYEGGLFEKRQEDLRSTISDELSASFHKVMGILRSMYKNFKDGSSEVQREWKSQIHQIDRSFETALKACVKRSLQDLSKAINGDSKTEPQSLFTVRIMLEKGVNYAPSMIDLTHNLNVVAKEIINVVTRFPRLRSQNFDDEPGRATDGSGHGSGGHGLAGMGHSFQGGLTAKRASLPPGGGAETDASAAAAAAKAPVAAKSYYEIISEDGDILRILVQVRVVTVMDSYSGSRVMKRADTTTETVVEKQ